MKLQARGDVWYVRFEALVDGKMRDKRISTGILVGADKRSSKARAQSAGAEKIREFITEVGPEGVALKLAQMSATSLRLSDVLDRVYAESWSKMKCAKQMGHVIPKIQNAVGFWQISETTTVRLRGYARHLVLSKDEGGHGLRPATANRHMSAISKALRVCVEDGLLQAMPIIPYLEVNNIHERYMTDDEEVGILAWLLKMQQDAAAENRTQWAYLHDLFVFLLDTGFRWSEAYKFHLQGNLAVLPHGHTKTGTGRAVPLTRRAFAAAKRLLDNPTHRNPDTGASWFWCAYRFRLCVSSLGIEDLTLHILRHTCASRLVQRGVNIYDVSKWLGHSNVTTTQRYAHLAPDAFAGALSALESPLGAERLSNPGTP
jgi:integrase